jgi:hypothetical protein
MTTMSEDTNGISRRNLIRSVALVAGGAAIAVATGGPAEAKMTQQAAGYQEKPKDSASCSNCTLFKPPSSCTLVDGTINPNGWCRFYVKKS